MRILYLLFVFVAFFGIKLADACSSGGGGSSSTVIERHIIKEVIIDLNPEVIAEMKKQEVKIDHLVKFMETFTGQLFNFVGVEAEQTAKMIKFIERLDDLQKDTYRDIKDIMKGASRMEAAINEYETMTTAEINKIMEANKLAGLSVNALRVKVQSKMSALEVNVNEISRRIKDFKEEFTIKIKELSIIVDNMNLNITAMARRLGGVLEETKKITALQLYQANQLTDIASELTSLEEKADMLRDRLINVNELVRGDLNQSSQLLRSNIYQVFAKLEDRIKQIGSAQDMHRLITEFGSTVDRLHYLAEFRNTKLKFNKSTRIWEPEDIATLWSNKVLDGNKPQETIDYIISQLHKLTAGDVSDGFAEHKSIYTVFREGARRFIIKEQLRIANSPTELHLMKQDFQTSSQSELFFVESLQKEVQRLQTESFIIQGQARQIRFNNTVVNYIRNMTADDEVTSTVAPVTSASEIVTKDDDDDQSEDLSPPVVDDEIVLDRRRGDVAIDEVVKKMHKEFTMAERNYTQQAIAELTQLQKAFDRDVGLSASPSYKKEPIFYMYADKRTQRLQTGYADIVDVSSNIRPSYVAYSKEVSAVPSSLTAKPKRAFFISGCRVCKNCSPQSKLLDKVNVQCAFRDKQITNFIEQDAAHEIYPRTAEEISKSEADMAIFAALKPTPRTRNTTPSGRKTSQKQSCPGLPPVNQTAASAVTGVISVPDPSSQTVCGIIVGQPLNFDCDLSSRGIAAITIEYCNRKTGDYLGRRELPKWTSPAFSQSYKIVSANTIFDEWVQPIPDGWITGVGFSLTSTGALTFELHSRLF